MMLIALDLDLTDMDDPISIIARSGASGTLIAEFRVLMDATDNDGGPKYRLKPVLHGLARFITRSSGGPNKDSELFELCNLAAILGRLAPGASSDFFQSGVGFSKATAPVFRALIQRYGEGGDGLTVDDGAVAVKYGDGEFAVRYGRMPLLAALYEFLIASDGFGNYQLVNNILDGLAEGAASMREVQDVANALSTLMRQYRRKHIERAKFDENFYAILAFLRARTGEKQIHKPIRYLVEQIDDEMILDFWVTGSDSGDFRVYKTVFEKFIQFMKAVDLGGRTDAIEHSSVIGTDFEAHEVEPDDAAGDIFTLSDWESPLAVLSEGAAADIKFLKKEGEQKPIEGLMKYGRYAERLAMAFLRLESFGPVQAGITNDLQVKRGRASVESRIDCADAQEYRDKIGDFEKILAHVKQLQKAAHHVLTSHKNDQTDDDHKVVSLFGNASETAFQAARNNDTIAEIDAADMDAIGAKAATAFRKIVRKGFEESVLEDEDRIQGYRIGADALVDIENLLVSFIKTSTTYDAVPPDLAERFAADRATFAARFQTLYGEAQ